MKIFYLPLHRERFGDWAERNIVTDQAEGVRNTKEMTAI